MPHMPGFGSWICIFLFLSLIAIVVLAIVLPRRTSQQPPYQAAFPVGPVNIRGWYVVYGVDSRTKADTAFRVEADSDANARVKAELEGIIVTSVQFEAPIQ